MRPPTISRTPFSTCSARAAARSAGSTASPTSGLSSRPALIDVTDVERRPDEEMFGPVLQVIRVPDFDAAIAEANATRYGLAASLVGGSPELYDRFWANVRAGVVNWNKPTNGAPSQRAVRRHRP